ncbi:MAG: thioredoxin fold domain-containing protein [Hyphomicrobiaceae bacterium]
MGPDQEAGLDEETQLPAWVFRAAAGLAVLFTGLAVAFAMLSEPEPEIAAPVSGRPTLVVVESQSCGWCRRFRESMAPAYERSRLDTLAPLRYIDLTETRSSGYRFSWRVSSTPTFVMVDRSGREVGRIRGYMADQRAFFGEVESLLAKVPEGS